MSKNEQPAKGLPVDAATVLNPALGISLEDLFETGRDLLARTLTRPAVALEQNARLLQDWTRVAVGASDLAPNTRDPRFSDMAWKESAVYRRSLQSWMAWRKNLLEWVDKIEFEEIERRRAEFFVELIADAFAPTNFLLGNPAALKHARETRGASLLKGFKNYLDDLRNNGGYPSQVDKSQFEVGGNIANTPGAVVYRDEIAELIQYTPTTRRVSEVPVFIVPPQINKYYLYDMSPQKSFIKHAVDQGLQVFVLSWRNPQKEHRDWGLDDYCTTIEHAIDAATEISGQAYVNAIGACAGGITLVSALGYLTAIEKHTINSLTLMVNVLVNDPDDSMIGIFANETSIDAARKRSARKGVLKGDATARVFNWMRPNDLIWNYVVSNYLRGESPPAFDILFWNADTTNLPARLHSDFLDFFDQNPFREGGDWLVRGERVRLEDVGIDSYITGGSTDHITPWHACYRSTQLFGGPVTYMLSTAGHIQSVVNPPARSKRKYYLNPETPKDHQQWLADATEHDGSWWPHWYEWVKERGGEEVVAMKKPGSRAHPALCAAPGTYVHESSS